MFTTRKIYLSMLLLTIVVGLVYSGFISFDRTTWILEIFPVLVGLPLLWFSRTSHPLTILLYTLLAIHAVILIVGGTYSYARVPLGFALQDWLHLSRNPYDKIGHFAQGFIPALIARELLLGGAYVQGHKMLAFICISIALAISALYELIEWAAALILGQGADEFLGTQGDVWDTQSDMAMALLGACCALALLSQWQDRQMNRLR